MQNQTRSLLVKKMACHLVGTKPLSEQSVGLLIVEPLRTYSREILTHPSAASMRQ